MIKKEHLTLEPCGRPATLGVPTLLGNSRGLNKINQIKSGINIGRNLPRAKGEDEDNENDNLNINPPLSNRKINAAKRFAC